MFIALRRVGDLGEQDYEFFLRANDNNWVFQYGLSSVSHAIKFNSEFYG